MPGDETGVGQARATHTDELPGYAPSQHRGDPQHDDAWPADTTLVQAMYGMPLGPDEEERTVSEYMTTLQGGLRAAYQHAREGLQRCIKNITTTAKFRGESTKPESWYGFTT